MNYEENVKIYSVYQPVTEIGSPPYQTNGYNFII